jgi:hypothetical protein
MVFDVKYGLRHKARLVAGGNWTLNDKEDIFNMSNQKENKSCIPYEYQVGDQVSLETAGILRKLSTHRTGPYLVTNVCKNITIGI